MPVLERPAAEQALAERIRAATKRLSTEFRGYFTDQAIEQCTLESLEPYRVAPVLEFVPLLVERMARERLIASLQGQTP
jgi:hypothetical protein